MDRKRKYPATIKTYDDQGNVASVKKLRMGRRPDKRAARVESARLRKAAKDGVVAKDEANRKKLEESRKK